MCFALKPHRLPCGCLTEPLLKRRIHEVCEHVYCAYLQPLQALCVSAQAPWRSGESINLLTSSTPKKGCVAPLEELILKTPLRSNF